MDTVTIYTLIHNVTPKTKKLMNGCGDVAMIRHVHEMSQLGAWLSVIVTYLCSDT